MTTDETGSLAGQDANDKTGSPNDDVELALSGQPAGEKAFSDDGNATKTDPNLVDWDGPGDPKNPRNWSKSWKIANISLLSLCVLYSNLATTMFAPGANIMAADLDVTSETVMVLTITIGSLGFALGQLFVAPMSEVFGRVPIYRTSAIFYLGFTVGCARSNSAAELIVFRLLTGMSASSYMTCGGGTIADLLPKEERGSALALFSAGPLMGPVLGPIIGGFVTSSLGWRWTFYLVLMFAGAVNIASIALMRETNAVMLLRAKAVRLRKETGNMDLRAANDKQVPFRQLVANSLLRPPKMLIMSPMVLFIALYQALIFGIYMLLFATFPTIYEKTYHWSVGVSGLAYIGVGIGAAIGLVTYAKLSDRLLKGGGTERRLLLMMWLCPTLPAGIFIYAWTTYYRAHWIAPIIGTGIAGVGLVVVNASSQNYVIDMFGPQTAASALAAITLLRNMTGAFLSLAAPALYDNLGLGWGNSVLAFLTAAFIPLPWLLYWRGEWLREKFPVKL